MRRVQKITTFYLFILNFSYTSLSFFAPTYAQTPLNADVLWEGAKIDANIRFRYEHVDQDGFERRANATTVRARGGLTTGELAGFSLRVEGEAIGHIGSSKFNDTVNGQTQFPIVADPEDGVLNQAYIRYKGVEQVDAKIGRQVITIANHRWVGHVGFRQNNQVYDAANLTLKPIQGASANYIYIRRINRIFGPDNTAGIFRDNDIHLLTGNYKLKGMGNLSAYAYFIDIPDAPALSNQTFGARLTGSRKVGDDLSILYELEYAHQSDHGGSPLDYSEDYFHIVPGLKYGAFTLKAGYEYLGGNGKGSVRTPLATLHAFNGWADKFLATPLTGLEDFYGDIAFQPKLSGWLKDMTFRFVYHDFSSTTGGINYGKEYDALINKRINKHTAVQLKYANYRADQFSTDTEKLWFAVTFSY